MSFISLIRQARYEENSNLNSRAFNSYSSAILISKNQRTIARLTGYKGWCLHKIGNYEQAIAVFNNLYKEIIIEDSFVISANYFYKTGKLKTSKTILKRGIELIPDNVEIYLILASILKDTERANESIEVLKKALSRENLPKAKCGIGRKDIWAELGSLYFDRGSFNSCIVCLKRALLMDSEETFLHYALIAKSYLILSDPKSALFYIDKQLLHFDEFDPEDYITKARCHAQLGENHLASASLLQAYDRSTDGVLEISTEAMSDFAVLMQNGFFDTIEKFRISD